MSLRITLVEAGMNEPRKIRILSVDDHPVFREGIAVVIRGQPDMALVAQGCSAKESVQLFRECRPDVTLMDVRLRDGSGIEAMAMIRGEFPTARLAILTSFEGDAEIARAFAAGACSYMLKSMPPAELLAAIRKVHAGKRAIPPEVAGKMAQYLAETPLTTRETQVLREIAEGCRNRSIAGRLLISEDTVKAHVKNLLEKLGASGRAQAVAIGARRGFIEL